MEPVIGVIKEVLGFRQFSLRGLAGAAGEWVFGVFGVQSEAAARAVCGRAVPADGQIEHLERGTDGFQGDWVSPRAGEARHPGLGPPGPAGFVFRTRSAAERLGTCFASISFSPTNC